MFGVDVLEPLSDDSKLTFVDICWSGVILLNRKVDSKLSKRKISKLLLSEFCKLLTRSASNRRSG
jgi:hypothetical protein